MGPEQGARSALAGFGRWLDRVDPGLDRRIKGLRLVTAFGLAAMLGTMGDITRGLAGGPSLGLLAGNFALWASVSEARGTRAASSRDLVLLCAAAAAGAASVAVLGPPLARLGPAGPELVLVSGAFGVGYLRRFGVTGTGLGSQLYIGQLLAYGLAPGPSDLPAIAAAGVIAVLASVVPRVLSGPSEHPPDAAALPSRPGRMRPELAMGLQTAAAALSVVALNAAIGLTESAWAITTSTYVIAGTATTTMDRVRRRIVGTMVGVPAAIALLHVAATMPLLLWTAAALAW